MLKSILPFRMSFAHPQGTAAEGKIENVHGCINMAESTRQFDVEDVWGALDRIYGLTSWVHSNVSDVSRLDDKLLQITRGTQKCIVVSVIKPSTGLMILRNGDRERVTANLKNCDFTKTLGESEWQDHIACILKHHLITAGLLNQWESVLRDTITTAMDIMSLLRDSYTCTAERLDTNIDTLYKVRDDLERVKARLQEE